MVLEILVLCAFVAYIVLTIATYPSTKRHNEFHKEYNELLRQRNLELTEQNSMLAEIIVQRQRKEKAECVEGNTQKSSEATTNLS